MIDDTSTLGVLAAVLTTLVSILGLLVRTNRNAAAANRAVNNVGPGEHSLWDQVTFIREDVQDLVAAQRDFAAKGWATLPDDIATASRLTETIRALQAADRRQAEILADVLATIREHDRWERQQKAH